MNIIRAALVAPWLIVSLIIRAAGTLIASVVWVVVALLWAVILAAVWSVVDGILS